MHPAHQPSPAPMPPACRAAGDPGHQSRNVTITMVPLITHRHIYFAGTLVRHMGAAD